MNNLADKTVLVTGASKGVGAVMTAALGASGATVVAHYGEDRVGAEQATAEIDAERRHLLAVNLDAPGAGGRLWDQALDLAEDIDVVVCNAATTLEIPIEVEEPVWDRLWERMFRVNVLGAADLMRAATRHFLGRGGGTLILMSSWVAQQGSDNPDLLAYAASKAAVKALAQTLARAHAQDGLLVYVLAPADVRTRKSEISADRLGGEQAVTSGLTMEEWIPSAQIAELVVFLSSGKAQHLTGATLDINGARYIR